MQNYIRNHRGTMVVNRLTKNPIPKSTAIDIYSPLGDLHTWDATGLYDWFVVKKNNHLKDFIYSLTPVERFRIIDLTQTFRNLERKKKFIEKNAVVKGGVPIFSNATTNRLYDISRVLVVLGSILVKYVAILYYMWIARFAMAIGPLQTAGALSAVHLIKNRVKGHVIDSHRRSSIRYVQKGLEAMEKSIGKDIDLIVTGSEVATMKYYKGIVKGSKMLSEKNRATLTERIYKIASKMRLPPLNSH